LIVEYGLLLVLPNVLRESLGLPVPAMPTLILTGAITSLVDSHGDAREMSRSLFNVVLVAASSALVGDLFWFWRRGDARCRGLTFNKDLLHETVSGRPEGLALVKLCQSCEISVAIMTEQRNSDSARLADIILGF
jgi:hypothetical protein